MPDPVYIKEWPRDVPEKGTPAQAEYGPGASIDFPGYRNAIDKATRVRIFQTLYSDADRYRMPFLAEWQQSFRQYNGDGPDLNKGAWQSRVNVPLPYQNVNTATDRIISSLFQNDDFFDILPSTRQQTDRVEAAKAIIKWQMWKSNARKPIEIAIKDAIICGHGTLKVYFEPHIEERIETYPELQQVPDASWFARSLGRDFQTVNKFRRNSFMSRLLRLEAIIPTDIWIDPSGRGDFIIQRVRRRLSDVWALTEDQKDKDGQVLVPAIYDKEEVRKIRPGSIDSTADTFASLIRRDTPHLVNDQGVDLYEFWGDIRDPQTGAVIYHNVVATYAMKQWEIRAPQENPFWHGMAPYINFTYAELPHQVYGYGMLFPVARVQDAINRQFNVILDKGLLQVPTVECDPLAARNPAELTADKTHFVPGKVWQRKSQERQIFFPVTGFPPPSAEDLQIIDRLMSIYQMGTSVNEFASGQTLSDNRKTKEEVQARVAAAQATFNASAQHIEQDALSPLMKMIYYLAVQYLEDYSDENLMKMVGDSSQAQAYLQSLSQMDEATRWDTMYLDAEFRVTGVTLQIQRQTKLQNLSTLMKMVQANPILMSMISTSEFLKQVMLLLDQPQDMVISGAEAILQAQQQAQIQQLTNPQQGQQQQGGGQTGMNPNNQAASAQAEMRQQPMGEEPTQ